MPRPNEVYLGDGVYVSFDGYQLRLTTSSGTHITNEIFLEPGIYSNLVKYVDKIRESVTPGG